MRAMLSERPGGPETLALREVAAPEPKGSELCIRVRAVGINYPDLLIIEDRYQFKPERPFAPGAEVAGVVDACGPDVAGWAPGDRVMAMCGWGGLCEAVCVPAAKCSRVPEDMPFEEAASLLMTYGTAHHALADRGGLKPGETLVVLGAGGGVGLAAVELGVALGARVVAAASSEAKLSAAIDAGATAGILYPSHELSREEQRDLSRRVKEACDGGADVVLDPVGGSYAEPVLRSMAWEGRYLVVGFPAGIPNLPFNLPLLKGCDVRGIFWGAAIERDPDRHQASVRELLAFYGQGRIKPRIHGRYELERAGEAIAELATRGVTGKIVVTLD